MTTTRVIKSTYIILLVVSASFAYGSKKEDCILKRNSLNYSFYNHLQPDELDIAAKMFTLDTCPDLQTIKEVVLRSKQILEIGAGSGRIINGILEINSSANITGIEPANMNFDKLQKRYKSNKRVKIRQKDIIAFRSKIKYDLVTWMWSGILDLDPQGQQKAIKNLAKHLAKGGTIVIDVPDIRRELGNVSVMDQQDKANIEVQKPIPQKGKWSKVEEAGVTLNNYNPSPFEIKRWCQDAGLVLTNTIEYSLIGRTRTQFIITKP